MYHVAAKIEAKANERMASRRQMTLWKPERGGGVSGGGGASPWGTGIVRLCAGALHYHYGVRGCDFLAASSVLRAACCVLRAACCVLCAVCCVCCVLHLSFKFVLRRPRRRDS